MIKDRLILFLKGMCMGFADVIPGVSGGTLALVLGIYKEFVDTLRGLHLRWLPLALAWLRGGRKPEDLEPLKESIAELNLPFLITLVAGIGAAVLVGSTFIPYLLENHPVPTKAFFFGLILASVYVPVRMILDSGAKQAMVGFAVVMAIVGAGFGYIVTNPSSGFEVARTTVEVTSTGETLKDISRRGPTSATAEQIYWSDENAGLREAVAKATPAKAKELEELRAAAGELRMDKKELKARAKPYHEVEVPSGVAVTLPQPALWFIAIAGAIAICAMILPGISGSYILLIFGVYFFILNALKGMLGLLAQGQVPVSHITYLSVFGVALIVGILSFARLLSYLLSKHAAPTLGLLVGLMIGCLRGIWPFQEVIQGAVTNVVPSASAPGTAGAAGALVFGIVLVAGLTLVGQKTTTADEA